jgi:hypothetical protein
MSNKKATVIAQQAAFAESLGARKYIGYTGNRNNVYVINGGDTCRAEAQFELGMNSQQTLLAIVVSHYARTRVPVCIALPNTEKVAHLFL